MKSPLIAIVSICLLARSSLAADRSPPAPTGWQAPPPPYPVPAMEQGIQGSGSIRVTTDRFGNVVKAVVLKRSAPILDQHTVSFVQKHWKGPPNSSATFPFIYQIDRSKASPSPKAVILVDHEWRIMRPTYPQVAIAARAEGNGVVRVSTDRHGRVKKAEIIEKFHPLLDAHTVDFARKNWTGPPDATRDVTLRYQLK